MQVAQDSNDSTLNKLSGDVDSQVPPPYPNPISKTLWKFRQYVFLNVDNVFLWDRQGSVSPDLPARRSCHMFVSSPLFLILVCVILEAGNG